MIERQVFVTWHTPEEKMPEEHFFVIATISLRADRVTYDHALVVANWADDGDGWIFEDPIAERFKDRVTIHAWCDLRPYGNMED